MMITLLRCLLADKIDSQMSIGPQYLRKVLRLTLMHIRVFLIKFIIKRCLPMLFSSKNK